MNNKGFTLIESLISMFLLAIVLVAGIRLYDYADQLTTLAIHKKVAVELVTTTLETLKNTPYSSLVNNTTVVQVGGLAATATTTIIDVDAAGLPITPPPPAAFKQVNIGIFWNESEEQNPRNIQLVTYFAP